MTSLDIQFFILNETDLIPDDSEARRVYLVNVKYETYLMPI